MPFDPSGLPTLPTCESDIARWADDLQTWLVSKLSVAHGEIDNVVVDPFDICAELGNLSAPSCLVPATGIDTSSFVYAEDGAPVTPGTLPWPGDVLADLLSGTNWPVYQGMVEPITLTGGDEYHDVIFPTPFPDTAYFVVTEPTQGSLYYWWITDRSPGGFRYGMKKDTPNVSRAGFIWTAVYFGS